MIGAIAIPRPLRVLCDVDGVLADFMSTAREYAHTYYPSAKTSETLPHHIDVWDPGDALGVPKLMSFMRDDPHIGQWCRGMREFPMARAFWAQLCAHPRVGVVNVATVPFCAAWLTPRAQWLESFGIPLKQQTHIHAKEALAGGFSGWDVLIDDNRDNCEAFHHAGGRAFMIARAYNSEYAGCVQRGDYADCLRWLSTR